MDLEHLIEAERIVLKEMLQYAYERSSDAEQEQIKSNALALFEQSAAAGASRCKVTEEIRKAVLEQAEHFYSRFAAKREEKLSAINQVFEILLDRRNLYWSFAEFVKRLESKLSPVITKLQKADSKYLLKALNNIVENLKQYCAEVEKQILKAQYEAQISDLKGQLMSQQTEITRLKAEIQQGKSIAGKCVESFKTLPEAGEKACADIDQSIHALRVMNKLLLKMSGALQIGEDAVRRIMPDPELLNSARDFSNSKQVAQVFVNREACAGAGNPFANNT